MSDAELIYNAFLRAERRVQEELDAMPHSERIISVAVWDRLRTINLLREEIGRGLSQRVQPLAYHTMDPK